MTHRGLESLVHTILTDLRLGPERGIRERSREYVMHCLESAVTGFDTDRPEMATAALDYAARIVVDEWPLDSAIGRRIVEASQLSK